MKTVQLIRAVIVAVIALTTENISAQTTSTWSGAVTSGVWNSGENWTGGVPVAGGSAWLTNTGATYTITYGTALYDSTSNSLGTLTVGNSGADTTTLAITSTFNIGSSAASGTNFTINAGGKVEIDTGGTLTVTGQSTAPGGTGVIAGVLTINGGTFNSNDGGLITLGGGGAINLLSGSFSDTTSALRIGQGGTSSAGATFNVSGGTMTARQISVGRFNAGNVVNLSGGSISVSGSGSPYVGLVLAQTGGDGAFNLSGTGQLSNAAAAQIGNASGHTGLFTQTGGVWNQTGGDVYVGYLDNSKGTYLFSGGQFNGSGIAVHVGQAGQTSAASQANNLSISGGAFAAKTVDVKVGSVAISGGTTTVTNLIAAAGTAVTLTGGSLNVTGTTNYSAGAAFTVGDGAHVTTLNLTGDNHTFSNGLAVTANGILIGSTTLSGTGTAVTSAGTIDPGTTMTTGQLTVAGTLTLQSTSILAFELGGAVQGAASSNGYDYLHLQAATASLDGNLSISFLNGFGSNVTSDQTFTVLTADSGISGAFTNISSGSRLVTSDGLGSFIVTYDGNSIVLSDFQAVPESKSLTFLIVGLLVLTGMRQVRRRTVCSLR